MTTVFISHATKDDAAVDQLAAALEAAGLELWVDHRKIRPADNWSAEIQKALNSCDVGLLALSSLSAKSEECEAEYRRIRSLGKRLYVAMISTVEKSDFPWRLGIIQYVNVQADFGGGVHALASAMLNRADLAPSTVSKTGGYALTDDGLPFWQLELTLIGRDQQRVELQALLAERNRVVTIFGFGGVGKTRLAAEIATAGQFDGGVIWHEINENADIDSLTHLIRRHLKLDLTMPPDETWRVLSQRQILLVLDNAEDCRNEGAYAARLNTLDLGGGVRILMTSRNQWESLRGAKLYRLSAPGIDDAAQIVTAMEAYEPPDYSLRDHARAVADAARCHPKLIWYAVHWANDNTPADVIEMLRTLKGGDDVEQALDDIVRKTVARVQEQPNGGQAISDLKRLNVCRGGFTLEAARALMQGNESLKLLKRWGLVSFDRETQRHDIEVIVRHAVGEAAPAKKLHFDYFERLARQYSDHEDYARLALENDNLSAAFDWALAAREAGQAMHLSDVCANFLSQQGRFVQRLRWMQQIVTALDGWPEKTRADAQNALGVAYESYPFGDRLRNLELAGAAFEKALKFARPQLYPAYYAATQNNLAGFYFRLSELEDRKANLSKALSAYQEALKYRSPRDVPVDYARTQANLAVIYGDLAQIENRAANLRLAVKACKEALRYLTPENGRSAYVSTQNQLGSLYLDIALAESKDQRASLLRAQATFEEALKHVSVEDSPFDYAGTQNHIGNLYRAIASLENADENLLRAAAAFREALRYWTADAMPYNCALALTNLGRTLIELEDRTGALTSWRGAEQLFRQLNYQERADEMAVLIEELEQEDSADGHDSTP